MLIETLTLEGNLALHLFGFVLLGEIVELIGKETIARGAARVLGGGRTPPNNARLAQLKAELDGIDAKAEFAKWAKLRRQYDKEKASTDSAQAESKSTAQSIHMAVSAVLFIVTTVVPFIHGSYYRKEAVVFLPPGWFGPLAPLFALPGAPWGGVSCTVWSLMCRKAVATAKQAVRALREPVPVV